MKAYVYEDIGGYLMVFPEEPGNTNPDTMRCWNSNEGHSYCDTFWWELLRKKPLTPSEAYPIVEQYCRSYGIDTDEIEISTSRRNFNSFRKIRMESIIGMLQ